MMLVFEPPGGIVFHAQFARKLQRRGALLGLSEQVNGQEPRTQRHRGAVEQTTRGEGGLMLAAAEFIDTALLNCTAGSIRAVRADIAPWPA